mgnify:FL=1|tara:strand:- start:503 stop:901 length:399 start_codon:yes stop_codon:yes gene_type:complete
MATNKRTYPNDYFTWYNDDDRIAVLVLDTTSTSGERTKEKYDSYQGSDVTNGIRITFHSKYEEVTAVTNDLKTHAGLDSALHNAVVCYMKARLFEDIGDLQKAQYFRQMYETKIKKHRGRKSGVRFLSVPRL